MSPRNFLPPILAAYSGCKSYVELDQEVPLCNMTPVLSHSKYEHSANRVRDALTGTVTAA